MADQFPFGNNPATPDTWLGRFNTKSKRWMVSYDGSFSILCGYHSFIFLGLDNLTIGIANLYSCGPSVGLPVGKIFQAVGAGAKAADRVERAHENITRGYDTVGTARNEVAQDNADTGMALYRKMQEGIPQQFTAHVPFSFEDLAGTAGAVAGAEIAVAASAAAYMIDAGPIAGPIYFETAVTNVGDGLVNAGIGVSAGVWSVEAWHNLYFELGASAIARCRVENQSPSYDQPYRRIAGVHPFIAQLPPAGCSFAETGFNPMTILR